MSAWRKSPDDRVLPPEQLPDGRVRVVVEKVVNVTDDYVNGFMPVVGDLFAGDASMTGTRSRYARLIFLQSDIVQQGPGTRRTYRLTFETVPVTPTEFGLPQAKTLPGLYKNIEVAGSITTGTKVLTLTTGTTAGMKAGLLVNIVGVGFRTIDTVDSTTQLTVTVNAGATVTTAAVTVYSAIPAHQYLHRYLVAGDGSAPAFRVALDAPYYTSLPAGASQRYFTGETVAAREEGGAAFSIITRSYHEMPDTHLANEEMTFTNPGSLAASGSGMSALRRRPVTRLVKVTVTRTYSLGTPTATALGYALKRSAQINAHYRVLGDVADTYTSTDFDGYVCDSYAFSVGGGAGLFTYEGVVCDITTTTLVVQSTSDPTASPSGTLVISSAPGREPLFGNIWELVTTSLDFSQFT